MSTAPGSRLVLATLGVALSVAAGCGGDASEEGGVSHLTKEEFSQRADRICVRSLTRAEREYAQYLGQVGNAPDERAEALVEIAEEVFIPAFEFLIDEIRRLGAPRSAVKAKEALVDAMQVAVDDANADPERFLRGGIPSFSEAMERAADYGLTSCARAFEFGA
jgi:hypothetical protein